jgi:hypothetical protein
LIQKEILRTDGVNEIVPPYVEVDSTGFIVKGDETEIINL